jgi:hypothetical protein
MDIKIIILTALIGAIAAFSNTSQMFGKRKSAAKDERKVLPS